MQIELVSFGRAALFLGIPFVLLTYYLQWSWAKTCSRFIQVLIAEQSGGGKFALAPKSGGQVTIENPQTGLTRVWAINELATIEVLYPGIGFIPKFLQKTIRMAIVNEGDWEPLLNRSRHMLKVASPDLVKAFLVIAERADTPEDTSKEIKDLLDGVSTSPTREMIASPAVLGNLMQEKISELAVTVAKDIINPLQEAIKKLGQRMNPTVVYIGLGLIAVLLAFTVFMVKPLADQISEIVSQVAIIKTALGVK